MKKLLGFFLFLVSVHPLFGEVSYDKGVPTLEELVVKGYVEQDFLSLKKESQRRFKNIQTVESRFKKNREADLANVISTVNINKTNVTNVYGIEEVELRDNLLYVDGGIILDGYIKNYYQNIKSKNPLISEIIQIKDGYATGEIRKYSIKGYLSEKNVYKNNKREGVSFIYNQKGEIFEKTHYKKGKKNGLREVYNSKGGIMYKMNYKDGFLEGGFVEYYENKTPKVAVNYMNDKKDGEEKRYAPNGKLLSSYNYSKGLLDGAAVEYNPNNDKKSVEYVYKNGEPVTKTVFHENGAFKKTVELSEITKKEKKKEERQQSVKKNYLILEN